MMILLTRLLAIGALIFLLVLLFRRRPASSAGERRLLKETCPSCGSRVRLPAGDPGHCPSCGTPLARSPEGTLRIRVN